LITVGELDPSGLKRPPDRLDRSLLQFISALKSGQGVHRYLGRRCKVPNTQAESPPGHPTLDWQKNRTFIPISVEVHVASWFRYFGLISYASTGGKRILNLTQRKLEQAPDGFGA
jgi:hypothetical protein